MKIRGARAADVEAMLDIKQELRLDPSCQARGGFLLGSTAEAYRSLIEHAHVLVLEHPAKGVGGFAVVLPDAVLRETEIWARRDAIVWEGFAWGALTNSRVAYFDQLAVRADRAFRHYAPALAAAALIGLIRSGHEHLFATTVREPLANGASLPLLRSVGGRVVGQIEEVYPGVGRVVSDVHHAALGSGAAGAFFEPNRLAGRVVRMMDRVCDARGPAPRHPALAAREGLRA